MNLYAPSKGWFIASLIIAVIAVLCALSELSPNLGDGLGQAAAV
jgi:hypothetical protein